MWLSEVAASNDPGQKRCAKSLVSKSLEPQSSELEH